MGIPFRFTVCTLNLWESARWEERREPVSQFVKLHTPDIFCLQELRPESRDLLDACLPLHRRVEDAFPGWIQEGNIFWNAELFSLKTYGAEDIGQEEELRRLFWVELESHVTSEILWVATAHFTWPGHPREKATGVNLRIGQARRAVAAMDKLGSREQALLFMGDLNEHYHTLRVLEDEGGFVDSFSALGRDGIPTRPAFPTYHGPAESLDWIVHRGALRPLSTEVAHFYHGDMAVSDHWPVLATYTFS